MKDQGDGSGWRSNDPDAGQMLPHVDGYELTFALPFGDDPDADEFGDSLRMVTVAMTTSAVGGALRYEADVKAALMEAVHRFAEKLSFDSGMTLLGISRAQTVMEQIDLPTPERIEDVRGSAGRDDGVVTEVNPGQTVSMQDRKRARIGKHLKLVHTGEGSASAAEDMGEQQPLADGTNGQPTSRRPWVDIHARSTSADGGSTLGDL